MRNALSWPGLDQWLKQALDEDLGAGDVTTRAVVAPGLAAKMTWVAKSPLVVAGLYAGARVFELLSPDCAALASKEEGAAAQAGETILLLEGPAAALLSGERVALNICQHLSGVATLTRSFVEAVAGTHARIAATRKTMPLMRRLEKEAVAAGGGIPHRFGLDDGVLIKDNHLALAGSIREAVDRARRGAHHLLKIEIEVTSLAQVEEALAAGAELLLLDNMGLDQMREAVKLAKGAAVLEASGNITLENVRAVAETGVDIISSGALTHSAPAADISARLEPAARRTVTDA